MWKMTNARNIFDWNIKPFDFLILLSFFLIEITAQRIRKIITKNYKEIIDQPKSYVLSL